MANGNLWTCCERLGGRERHIIGSSIAPELFVSYSKLGFLPKVTSRSLVASTSVGPYCAGSRYLVPYIDEVGHLHIPYGYTFIKDDAYFENPKLVSVFIPSTVGVIGERAFSMCLKLKRIIFESDSSLNRISAYAFQGSSNLESIAIPSSVLLIGNYAFSQSLSMTRVYFGYGSILSSLGTNAFEESGIISIVIPATCTTIGAFAFYKTPGLVSVYF